MYKKLFCIVLLCSLTTALCGQTRNFSGDTQTEINFNAGEEYLKWKNKMESVLLNAIKVHKDDSLFVNNLKTSQKLWEAWRDAEIRTFYPEYEDSSVFYGSMQPLCEFSKLIDWTEQRILQLEIYLKGVEPGDACSPGKM